MPSRRAVAFIPSPQTGESLGARGITMPGSANLELLATVRGSEEGGQAAIATALRRIADGEATVLLLARLADAGGSWRELIALLDWLDSVGADLVALDVELDTGFSAGRRTVATLREVARWEQAPPSGRPPRGRPGVAALAPELGQRIAALRERGLSLQAIADALNDDGVPTQRGGARWRPSSVQAALGYKRPRAPLHGAPAPPRHGPGHPPPPPPRLDDPRPPRDPRKGGPGR
jgi:DNA invertase Pin-like site-specific DNA recombinase